jgi:hypothetical protein
MSTKGIPSGRDGYNPRYVAFLDLLGFKALVERAEREPAEQERLMEVLRLLRDESLSREIQNTVAELLKKSASGIKESKT